MSGSNFKKNRGSGAKNNSSSLQKKIDKLKKPGKTYTKAQLLALKRKAMGKTIAQVRAENEEKMRERARKRHADFKAKQKLKIKNKKQNKKQTKDKDKKKVYVPNLKFIK